MQVLFRKGTLDRPGSRCRHLGLQLNASPVKGWGRVVVSDRGGVGQLYFPFTSPSPLHHFFTPCVLSRQIFPRPSPPQLPDPRWRANTKMRTRAPGSIVCTTGYIVWYLHLTRKKSKLVNNTRDRIIDNLSYLRKSFLYFWAIVHEKPPFVNWVVCTLLVSRFRYSKISDWLSLVSVT